MSTHTRALILGGAGSAGNAWLIGIVAGLLECGVDVTDADLIVGTSAGSTTAVQLVSGDPRELDEATTAPVQPRLPAGPATGPPGPEGV